MVPSPIKLPTNLTAIDNATMSVDSPPFSDTDEENVAGSAASKPETENSASVKRDHDQIAAVSEQSPPKSPPTKKQTIESSNATKASGTALQHHPQQIIRKEKIPHL